MCSHLVRPGRRPEYTMIGGDPTDGVECILAWGGPHAGNAKRLVKGIGRRVSERLERALAWEGRRFRIGSVRQPRLLGPELGGGAPMIFRPNRTTAICSHPTPRRLRSQLINVLNGAQPMARGRGRGRAPTDRGLITTQYVSPPPRSSAQRRTDNGPLSLPGWDTSCCAHPSR